MATFTFNKDLEDLLQPTVYAHTHHVSVCVCVRYVCRHRPSKFIERPRPGVQMICSSFSAGRPEVSNFGSHLHMLRLNRCPLSFTANVERETENVDECPQFHLLIFDIRSLFQVVDVFVKHFFC